MYYGDYNRLPEDEDIFEAPSYQIEDAAPVMPKNKRGGVKRWLALALVFAILGGIGGGTLVNTLQRSNEATTIYQSARTAESVKVATVDSQTLLSLPQLYDVVVDSVVGISVEHIQANYFGQNVAVAAAGSGFVITENGYIVTNFHVVYNDSTKKVSDKISVSFANGDSYTASYVGGEQENDIAVLKIEVRGLTPVVIGKSGNLAVGEAVAAIGNPLGELTFSMTDGIVSALDRQITTSDGTVMNMIQTNTAINPGNSGGPMFNMYGELVGITTSKYTAASNGVAAEGLGFIIPIDDVVDMLSDIMQHGYVTGKPYMGVIVSTVSSSDASRYRFPVGALISGVVDGSCSAAAGLQAGDIITDCNGVSIDSSAALIEQVNTMSVGDELKLTVYRNGETLAITVTLEESTPELQQKTSTLREQINSQQSNDYSYGYDFTWPFW